MKKYFISACFVLLAGVLMSQSMDIIISQQFEERNGKQYYIHQVKQGQTVYSIAKAYDVSVDEIYFENPSAKIAIDINQKLFIPTINKETEIREEIKTADFEFFYHVCRENETFSHIAEIYLQPESSIRKANPNLLAPFKEGEYLKVPVKIPESVIKAEFPVGSTKPTRNIASAQSTKKANTVSFNPNIAVIADYRHVVIAGETTSSIANKYQVSINNLKAVNPGLSDFVEKGDRLRIPATASFGDKNTNTEKPRPAPENKEVANKEPAGANIKKEESLKQEKKTVDEGFIIHKVKKKETIYRISRDYGVTIQELYDANAGLSEKIKIGQQIKVPKKKITNNYIIFVAKGKTKLRKIAKLYGLPESIIKNINPGIGKYIYRGQEIKIPVGRKAIIVSEEELNKEVENSTEDETNETDHEDNIMRQCKKEPLKTGHEIKIALMVPLFLEDLKDEDLVNEVLRGNAKGFQPFMFVNFIEGAMMAIDSLRKTGVIISMKVYDVDKSLTKTTKVLQDPELKTVDLIIGPFYNQSFNQAALFAGNFNIPIINPLTYRNQILKDYKTAIKIMPAEEAQIPLVNEIIKQYYPGAKVFFITQNSYRNADKVIVFENAIKENIEPYVKHSNLDLYNYSVLVAMRDEDWRSGDFLPVYQMEGKTMEPSLLKENPSDSTTFDNSMVRINYSTEGFDSFINKASVLRENIVVVYASDKRDKAFVMDVMNRLNEFRDSLNISLIGIPLWERLENIDLTQMDKLNTIDFESSFIDYNKSDIQDFIYNFRQQYSTDPGKYGFAGYDITMYFSNALYFYNKKILKCLPHYHPKSLSTNMMFKKSFINNSSYENYNWNIIKHQDLKKHKIYLRTHTENQ